MRHARLAQHARDHVRTHSRWWPRRLDRARVRGQPAGAQDDVQHGGEPGGRDRGAGDRRGGDPQHRLGEVDDPRLLQRHGRHREQDQLALHQPGPLDREPHPVHPAGHGSCQRGARLRRRRHAAVELRLRGQGHQLQLRPHDQRDVGHPAPLREGPGDARAAQGAASPGATTSTASPVARRPRRPTRSRTSTSRASRSTASRRARRCSPRRPCTPRTLSRPVRPRRSRPSRGSTALPTATRLPARRWSTRR